MRGIGRHPRRPGIGIRPASRERGRSRHGLPEGLTVQRATSIGLRRNNRGLAGESPISDGNERGAGCPGEKTVARLPLVDNSRRRDLARVPSRVCLLANLGWRHPSSPNTLWTRGRAYKFPCPGGRLRRNDTKFRGLRAHALGRTGGHLESRIMLECWSIGPSDQTLI